VDSLSEIIRDQARDGAAILFSSHQLELIERVCNRIVILERGRVLVAGTLPELGTDPQTIIDAAQAAAGWSTSASSPAA